MKNIVILAALIVVACGEPADNNKKSNPVKPAPAATANPSPTPVVTSQPAGAATPVITATATAAPEPTATAAPEPTATAAPEPILTATPSALSCPVPRRRVKCSEIPSCDLAKFYLKSCPGMTYLDHGGIPGVPCEADACKGVSE